MDGLAVGCNGCDLFARKPGFSNRSKRGAGKLLAKDKVQFTNLPYLAVKADTKDMLTHCRAERLVDVREDSGVKAPPCSGKTCHDRIDTISGGAGHQAHDDRGPGRQF